MATEKQSYLVAIHEGLSNQLDKQVAALPKDFNKQRFLQNCMTVLQGNNNFSKCDPKTVIRTLLRGAYLGIDFFNQECYAIPYGIDCQFRYDYKGRIKVAKRYSSTPIKDIYAKLVREGDEFTETIDNGIQTVSFKPIVFNDGNIIGAFAVCLYQDGSMKYETMSRADIEHTKEVYSNNSKAWKDSFGEMCKKTVIHRLCKLIDLNFDTAEAAQAYDNGLDADTKLLKKEVHEAHDIYATAEPVEEPVEPEASTENLEEMPFADVKDV